MSELPKIGEKCLHRRRVGESFREGECVGHDGCLAIIRDKEDDTYTGCYGYQLCPFKSEAERLREKQIDLMQELVVDRSNGVLSLGGVASRRIATGLHKAGCRMTHTLTADVIAELCRKHHISNVSGDGYDFAEELENIILGEN